MSAEQSRETVLHIARDLEAIYALLGKAIDDQWKSPPGISTVEAHDAGTHDKANAGSVKQKNRISDPTGDTVVNEARWELRRRLGMTEKELRSLEGQLAGIKNRLQSAMRPYL